MLLIRLEVSKLGEVKTRNHIRSRIQFEINSNLTFAEIERETDDLPQVEHFFLQTGLFKPGKGYESAIIKKHC